MNKEKDRLVKELVLQHDGLKVIRLKLLQNQTIPEHATHADVVIIGINGEGIFAIDGKQTSIKKGDVIHLKPDTKHAITATTDLELIVNLMQLKPVELNCDSPSCSRN